MITLHTVVAVAAACFFLAGAIDQAHTLQFIALGLAFLTLAVFVVR